MADYGGVGGGQSLRDALNRIMPMTGMGEWGAMFPPPTGADQPTASVPLPPPRPQIPPQGLPPGALQPQPPGLMQPQQPGIMGQPQLPPQAQFAGGMAPGGNYAARLGLGGSF